MFSDGDLQIRPIAPADLPLMHAWLVDATSNSSADSGLLLPLTWEQLLERLADNPPNQDCEQYAIAVEERLVGHCQLVAFDHLARSAEAVLTVAPAERGKDYGHRAVGLLVDHAFRDRGLHRVWTGVRADDEDGQRAYGAVGFIEETREREQHWVNGRYVDGIRMGLLRPEWDQRHAAR